MKDCNENRVKRNLNPHAEARLAMLIWGKEYSRKGCGSMDFWDYLDESRKKLCVEQVRLIKDSKSTDKTASEERR